MENLQLRAFFEVIKDGKVIKATMPNLTTTELTVQNLKSVEHIYYMAFHEASSFLFEVQKVSNMMDPTIQPLPTTRSWSSGHGNCLCNKTYKSDQDD